MLLPYLGDDDIQKELKLTADQSKKLLAYRQKVWDEHYNTAPKELDAEARDKATEAEFKAVLPPEQLKRANQLATQLVMFSTLNASGEGTLAPRDLRRVPGNALIRHPAITDVLRLDETQKMLLTTRKIGSFEPGSSPIYLSPAQTATMKELIGPEYKGTIRFTFDKRLLQVFGRSGRSIIWSNPTKDIQTELNLTADQLDALGKLGLTRLFGREPLSPAAQTKAEEELLKEQKQELANILDATQHKRLAEIERQLARQSEFVAESPFGKELGVTDAQRKKYEEVTAAHGEALAKAMLSGEPFEKVKAAVAALNTDREKAVAAILTADQQTKKKELLGPAFTGQVVSDHLSAFRERTIIRAPRNLSFGRYVNELTVLTRAWAMRDELKLTDDQIKKLAEAARDHATKFPTLTNRGEGLIRDTEQTQKLFADQSAFIEKVLTAVLTKEQQARFRELMLQHLEEVKPDHPDASAPDQYSLSAAGYPGVAEAIKLTNAQKKELTDGARPSGVLTGEQKKALAAMLGKPANVERLFVQLSFAVAPELPTPRPAVRAILTTAIWDELKLTPEQVGKLAPAANEYALIDGRLPRLGDFGKSVDLKEFVAAEEELGKVIDAILTPDQKRRLDQFLLQQAAVGSLDFALTGVRGPAETPKALALTPAQVTKLHAVGDEFHQLAELNAPAGRQPGFSRLDGIAPKQWQEIGLKLRDQLDARLLAELTDAQRAKWKELTGEPFPYLVKRALVGGSRGLGFGGPFGP